MGRRAVFLDRDGVINEAIVREGKPYPPVGIQETAIAADVEPSLKRLKRLGFLLLVVTNQPDVGRGARGRDEVEEIHHFLSERLPLDDFFVCYHDDADQCTCRKPLPGLLLDAASRYGVDLARSYMIGDRWRDIDAGAAAGCRTIMIDRAYAERRPSVLPDIGVGSITEAVDWILMQEIVARGA
jgi:D-glycero-D-manno-heptose 1,7-bisphosphate phosphatase